MLPFETLDKAELNSVRLDLVHQLQCFKCSTEDIQTLRDILVDILNLQHGLEDNLLVIQQIQQVDPGTGEDYKELALNTARQHIIDINSVYQQGLDWLKNDQACDTLELGDEDNNLVPDLNLDQLSSDCSKTKNRVEITPQSTSDGDESLPIDEETSASNKQEIEGERSLNSMSEDDIRVRAPNWSDRQSTCLKDLIKNLDEGDIYTAILNARKTMEGKERKKRAWDRVYREFRKIPGNKVFKLKHILCKYKNFKNELIEERRFQADGLPYYPSNGEDWMRTDQAGDTLGYNEEDIKEDLEVVPDLDFDQLSSDSSGFNKNIETTSEFDKPLPRGQEGNAANMFFNEERNKRRLVNSARGGGRRRRAPNWSEQQTAYLMDLIKTLDGGKIYTTLLNNKKTKVGIEKKERAWDRVYREFTKIPGNNVFKLKHLFFKYKNIRKLNKELLEERRSHAVQTDGLPDYPSNGLNWMRNDQACDTLGSDYEDVKEDPDIVMDQFSTDCPGIQNNKERNEQITSEFGKLLPMDQEENASILFERERERKRTVKSVSEGRIRLRAPNWSDQQSACLKDLIMTLDGGSIYTTLLSYNKTKDGKERKMRAWDRVYREFTKIPGNKVFKLKHLFCKYKNFKKELIEEGGFQVAQAVQAVQAVQTVQADGLPHYPSNGLDWMGNDQACDTLGSDDIEEDIKVVPEIEFSPDCSEIKNEKEILDQSVSEYDKSLLADQEENASILLDKKTCGKRLNSKSEGGKRLRVPNWSDQQLACLQSLIKTLDGGNICSTILSNDLTNAGKHRKKRAWYRVHKEFTKVPGNEVFEVGHLIIKFKNYRNSRKEIPNKIRDLSAQAGVPPTSLPSGVEQGEPPQFSAEQSRLFLEIVESVNKKDIIDSPINTAAMKKKKIEVWRNIHAQFEERSGCSLFSIQNLIGEYRNLLFYRKEISDESRLTLAQSGVPPPLSIVNLQPLEMDTGSMGSMVGLGMTPPQFTQEQSRLFLEIVESVNKKDIIDSPINTAAMKKKKIEVWRNIHAQFEERSSCNLFSIQNLIGKYRALFFKHKQDLNSGEFVNSSHHILQEQQYSGNQGSIINLNTYYRPILPKLPEEDLREFLDVPVKVEIHDGDEERNPLDASVKDEEDPLKIFDNPVKGEINDEEDPLQIP